MRDLTLSDIERLQAEAGADDVAFEMDEDSFRGFYERTARMLWAYLAKATGDPQSADDLLQESYYRFLRARAGCQSEAHRRAYLFRIAINLVHDGRRRQISSPTIPLGDRDVAADQDATAFVERRADLQRAMQKLRPRDRTLLWLAYGVGQPHAEIAGAIGVKTGSVKLMLFRARRRLAALLRARRDAKGNGHDLR